MLYRERTTTVVVTFRNVRIFWCSHVKLALLTFVLISSEYSSSYLLMLVLNDVFYFDIGFYVDTKLIQDRLIACESLKGFVELCLKARSDPLASKSKIIRIRNLNDIFENWISIGVTIFWMFIVWSTKHLIKSASQQISHVICDSAIINRFEENADGLEIS